MTRTIALLLILSLPFLSSCASESREKTLTRLSGTTMGTIYRIKIVAPEIAARKLKELSQAIQLTFARLNLQLDHYDPQSEISEFNHHADTSPIEIGRDFSRVVDLSLQIHKETEGAFDITVGPLVDLWGFGPGGPVTEPPSAETIQTALHRMGSDQLRLDIDQRLRKLKPQIEVNLSAIAKGYAVDELASLLKSQGFSHFLVEVGGEALGMGNNLSGEPWTVGIVKPAELSEDGNPFQQIVKLSDRVIATSGNYENYFEYNGERFSHTLDPRTGHPVPDQIASVSVIAPAHSPLAVARVDAVATALTVMGLEAALAWVERHKNLEALIVVRSDDGRLTERSSSGFSKYIN